MDSTKFDGGPLVDARNPDEKSVLLNFWPLTVLFLIVSVPDEMKSVVCYAFDATVRCVASAAICFQPFFAAMSSVHVAMLAASRVCPGLALFLKWLGRGLLKNHESSGLFGIADHCEHFLFPLKGRVFESSGFTGAASDLESHLFPLKGHVFESSGFSGAVSDLESPFFLLTGHVFEFIGLPGFVSSLQSCMLVFFSGNWFEPQGFVSLLKEQLLVSAGLFVMRCIANVKVVFLDFVTPLKEQVLAVAGFLVLSCIANVLDGDEVTSGSHAAAALSGDLHVCSRKPVQASGRVDVQSGDGEVAACFPLSHGTGLHTRTKDTLTNIPVQASSYSVFVKSFTGSTMVLSVFPSMTVSALVLTIAERCQIPHHLFYLTLGGRVVDCGLTVREGRIDKDA